MIYVGVDVGGMSIKIGLVSSDGKILLSKAFTTEQEKGFKSMFARTADMINELIAEGGYSLIDLGGIGIGILMFLLLLVTMQIWQHLANKDSVRVKVTKMW